MDKGGAKGEGGLEVAGEGIDEGSILGVLIKVRFVVAKKDVIHVDSKAEVFGKQGDGATTWDADL